MNKDKYINALLSFLLILHLVVVAEGLDFITYLLVINMMVLSVLLTHRFK